jgi:hypothetical protein
MGLLDGIVIKYGNRRIMENQPYLNKQIPRNLSDVTLVDYRYNLRQWKY